MTIYVLELLHSKHVWNEIERGKSDGKNESSAYISSHHFNFVVDFCIKWSGLDRYMVQKAYEGMKRKK